MTREKEEAQHQKLILDQQNQSAVICPKDCKGVLHVLACADLIHVTADRNYTVFGCLNQKSIRVRKPISEVAKLLPEYFYTISRSCIVNLNYVQEFKAPYLITTDGSRFSVPAKKRNEMKKLVTEWGLDVKCMEKGNCCNENPAGTQRK